MDQHKSEWESSYGRKENFLFYPNEEVIRFAAKYVCKQTGLKEFRRVYRDSPEPKVLDLGCGIGRHTLFFQRMGLEAYGIDLSETAVAAARSWAQEEGLSREEAVRRIVSGSITELPWKEGFFHVIVSHGVLDSMQFSIAEKAVAEAWRVTAPGALFYCDLISGDDSEHAREFAGEEILQTQHEQGTVQSYFNFEKISRLFAGKFEIIEPVLVRMENLLTGGYISRHHLALKRIGK